MYRTFVLDPPGAFQLPHADSRVTRPRFLLESALQEIQYITYIEVSI